MRSRSCTNFPHSWYFLGPERPEFVLKYTLQTYFIAVGKPCLLSLKTNPLNPLKPQIAIRRGLNDQNKFLLNRATAFLLFFDVLVTSNNDDGGATSIHLNKLYEIAYVWGNPPCFFFLASLMPRLFSFLSLWSFRWKFMNFLKIKKILIINSAAKFTLTILNKTKIFLSSSPCCYDF